MLHPAGLYDADEVAQLYVAAPQTTGYIVPFRQLAVRKISRQ